MGPMTASAEWRVPVAAIPSGGSAKFRLARGGRTVEGFVVHYAGGYHAFVNRCPHVGTPLDLWPNEFFSQDGRALICSTHGAIYEPDTGRCVGGPCAGDALEPLDVRREGATLVVGWRRLDDGEAGHHAPG
jgi:nitrite reductase/ring-hydroxylating ferredoxin subunit